MIRRNAILAVVGGALALGAVSAGGVLLAKSGTHVTNAQTPGTSPSAATATPAAGSKQADAQTRINSFLDDLAKNLNTDRGTLDNALKQTAKDQVAAAVQSGKLTQAEADTIDKTIDSGQFPKGFGIGFGRPGGGDFLQQVTGLQQALQDAFTKTVGESPDQFMTEVKGGKTPAAVFQEHNTSAQAVAQAESDAAKPLLAQAVQSKLITQDQENGFLNHLQKGGAFFGMAGGMNGGMHMRGPGNGQGASSNGAPAASSTPASVQ